MRGHYRWSKASTSNRKGAAGSHLSLVSDMRRSGVYNIKWQRCGRVKKWRDISYGYTSKGAGRKFSRRRRRSLNARSATWGAPNGGTRTVHIFYVGLVERIPRAQHNYSSWHSRELSGTARRSLGGDLCTKRDETRRNHNITRPQRGIHSVKEAHAFVPSHFSSPFNAFNPLETL